jgi:hypothetical protein
MAPQIKEALTFTYRNYRGEIAQRRVVPITVRWDATEWHPEPQWLLQAYDLDKCAIRDFAMADMVMGTTQAPDLDDGWHAHTPGDQAHIANLPPHPARLEVRLRGGWTATDEVGMLVWGERVDHSEEIVAWRKVQ